MKPFLISFFFIATAFNFSVSDEVTENHKKSLEEFSRLIVATLQSKSVENFEALYILQAEYNAEIKRSARSATHQANLISYYMRYSSEQLKIDSKKLMDTISLLSNDLKKVNFNVAVVDAKVDNKNIFGNFKFSFLHNTKKYELLCYDCICAKGKWYLCGKVIFRDMDKQKEMFEARKKKVMEDREKKMQEYKKQQAEQHKSDSTQHSVKPANQKENSKRTKPK